MGLLLDVLLPSQTHSQKKNLDQPTVLEFQIRRTELESQSYHPQLKNSDLSKELKSQIFHHQLKNSDLSKESKFQIFHHQLKNMDQLTDLESQTTTHTPQKKNTDQLTDSESQTITTKKDTQRVTTTQLDAFQ